MNKKNAFCLMFTAALLFACQQKPAGNSSEAPPQETAAAAERTAEDGNASDEAPLLPDFSLPDMNGKETTIMTIVKKNEITILDFWASWCGPCRAEMPSVVSLYDAYKDKGLGIVGISLDEDKADWQEAVEKMNMTWPQLSDLQGWNNKAARMFDVNGIPFTMVVDKEGRLLAAGLRGSDLHHFVEQRLK